MTQCLEQVVWTLALTANVGVGVVVDAADNSVHDPTTSQCAVPSRRRQSCSRANCLAGQRIQYLMVTHLWEVDGCELARRVKQPLG